MHSVPRGAYPRIYSKNLDFIMQKDSRVDQMIVGRKSFSDLKDERQKKLSCFGSGTQYVCFEQK